MENTNTQGLSSSRGSEAGRPYLMVIGGARVGELHKLTLERTVVGRSPEAQLRLADTGISREHAELVVKAGRVSVRDLGSTNGTFLNGIRADARELHDGDKLSLGSATLLVFTHDDGIERAYQRERFRAAVRDPATLALKREVFVERLEQEVSFSRRHAAPLAVLLWELDGFAALEARLGPAATRECLLTVARAASGALREDDLQAVLGLGKFGVACRETTVAEASTRAERLRAAVAQATFEGAAARAGLTASVGIALCAPGSDKTAETTATLLRTADGALNAARTRGGDRIEVDAASLEASER
jgi:two-component system cell cycle response regulator